MRMARRISEIIKFLVEAHMLKLQNDQSISLYFPAKDISGRCQCKFRHEATYLILISANDVKLS